jgi:transmembrane sensor
MAEKLSKTNEDFYYEQIARELSGNSTQEESKRLHEWVDRETEHRMFYDEVLKSWEASGLPSGVPDFDTEKAWQKIAPEQSVPVQPKGVSWLPAMAKVAAGLLVLTGILSVLRIMEPATPDAIAYVATDSNLELYLPDSSKVVLNKNSRLTYYSDFNENGRKVYLEGEAFFDVRKASGQTFEVYGTRSITTVLGTSFSVRSLSGEDSEEVQVVSGKVAFARKKDPLENALLLTPGEKGVLQASARLSKTEIKDPNFIAWKEQRLTFENTSVKEVAQVLEKYFELRITVQDSLLLNCRFTGEFEKPKADDILEVLTVSTESSYERNETGIVLKGSGCTDK